MPTYEYACTSCRRRFEVVQKFSDAPLTACEECGGLLKRVFHPVGVVLKGPGFYSTDNRSKKAPSPPKKEAASGSEAASGGSSGKGAEKTGAGDGGSGASRGAPGKKEPGPGSPAKGAGSAAS